MNSRKLLFLLTHCWLLTVASSTAGTLVHFRTSLGDMVVELYDQDKPVTVANFMRYVDSGRYTNIFFHRCVTNFVVQGGGFGVIDPTSTNLLSVYTVVEAYDPITNEFNVGPRCSNVYGTIAMAKVGDDPNSATCQWFFNLADNSANLDNQNGGFTVFGHVIKGTNVLEQFNERSLWNGIRPLDAGVFNAVPVTYAGTAWPHYNELIYVSVEPLSVGIRGPAAGQCTLSWNSVTGMINVVEYADTLSSQGWHPLLSTNPSASLLSVTDSILGTTNRLYRVRVE